MPEKEVRHSACARAARDRLPQVLIGPLISRLVRTYAFLGATYSPGVWIRIPKTLFPK